MKKFQLLKWTAEVREKELRGLKFANVDCLMLQEVEVDEDGDVVECEYLDIRYPEGE